MFINVLYIFFSQHYVEIIKIKKDYTFFKKLCTMFVEI